MSAEPPAARKNVVLFAHGLESGVTGSKVRALQRGGFSVVCEPMHSGLLRLDRTNSIPRCLLRDRWTAVWGAGVMAVAGGAIFKGVRWSCWTITVPAGLFLGVLLFWLLPRAVWASLRSGVAIQKRMLAQLQLPEAAEARRQSGAQLALVGSSWGAAVLLMLLSEPDVEFNGPVLLVAPALKKIIGKLWNGRRTLRERVYPKLKNRANILIIHGVGDRRVPIAHARELATACNLPLVEINSSSHPLTKELVHEGLLASSLNRLFAAAAADAIAPIHSESSSQL